MGTVLRNVRLQSEVKITSTCDLLIVFRVIWCNELQRATIMQVFGNCMENVLTLEVTSVRHTRELVGRNKVLLGCLSQSGNCMSRNGNLPLVNEAD